MNFSLSQNSSFIVQPYGHNQYVSIQFDQSQVAMYSWQLLASNKWVLAIILLFTALVHDQIKYLLQKDNIAGPQWKVPFMGSFMESINPKFEEYVAKWASGELSCVSVFHKFVVIASSREMSRKTLNSPQFVKPCVVDAAHKLLGKDNWVFLDGKAHVDFRKGLNGLFTREALALYLPKQEEVYDDYFQKFVDITKREKGKPFPFMPIFREAMCAVSCRTFVGDYISDESVKKISDNYYRITAALELVNFPLVIPFSKTWYGMRAAKMVLTEFEKCAAKSKLRIAAGGEVNCIMDSWVKAQLESAIYRRRLDEGLSVEDIEKPSPLLREFTNYEISQTIFTFLFASQDATCSACTWLFQIMAQRPDCLEKIRKENLLIRNGDRSKPITMKMIDQMVYTKGAVRELLRYRPPVLMIPYLVKQAFPISSTYTVPKGAMIVPAVYPSLRDPDIYINPDFYDPDRYVKGNAEERGSKNFLVFGTGPHYCLGQVYAQNNLALMIGKASMWLDWIHHPTPLSEKIKLFATIFPGDDCPLTFTSRPEESYS